MGIKIIVNFLVKLLNKLIIMFTNSLSLSFSKVVALVAIVAMLMWALGFPSSIRSSEAVNLTFVSDTLTDSDLGVVSDHAIVFTTPTAVAADGSTTTITFDASFNVSTSSATGFDFSDIDVSTVGLGAMTLAADCAAANHLGVTVTATQIIFEHCPGDAGVFDANGTTTILMGTNATGGAGNLQAINPLNTGSYNIQIETRDGTAALLDEGNTRIAIIDDVLVTASVDTNLTFIIYGLADGATVNGSPTTTATTTTATSLPFETLTSNVSKTLAQSLSVATNARNGYMVTLNQNQNLTSSTGADINTFIDESGLVAPALWQGPLGSIGTDTTYGHMGITSEDSTLSNGDNFGVNLWAGNFVGNPREVMYHDEPSDGIEVDTGSTTVGFQAEIMAFQEAGTDYEAVITYVVTPVF